MSRSLFLREVAWEAAVCQFSGCPPPPHRGLREQGSAVEDAEIAMTRLPSDDEPFSGLAFKVMADQFLGTLTFVRVYRCGAALLCYSVLGAHARERAVACCAAAHSLGKGFMGF